MRDSELLLYQRTILTVTQGKPTLSSQLYPTRLNDNLKIPKKMLYEVIVVDWDTYVDENLNTKRGLRVEEELINQTMLAQPITIKKLLIAPTNETPAIEGAQKFIEGVLRYSPEVEYRVIKKKGDA